jgi:hypothetical protein
VPEIVKVACAGGALLLPPPPPPPHEMDTQAIAARRLARRNIALGAGGQLRSNFTLPGMPAEVAEKAGGR